MSDKLSTEIAAKMFQLAQSIGLMPPECQVVPAETDKCSKLLAFIDLRQYHENILEACTVMKLFESFQNALPVTEFLAQFGSPSDRGRWQTVSDRVRLSDPQKALLSQFRRKTNVLVLAGAWCGDCVSQCPIFDHFAVAAPLLNVRYLDRDAYPQVQDELLVNGGKRVPVVVFFSEDGHEVARFGDRTLSKYRELMQQQTGETCASGIVGAKDDAFACVIQDWLDQFERVQWMLRLSPRLRQKYGD
ncbi:MAG: thioredoxin family protein [Gemmataceae bacterium]